MTQMEDKGKASEVAYQAHTNGTWWLQGHWDQVNLKGREEGTLGEGEQSQPTYRSVPHVVTVESMVAGGIR